MNRLSEFGISEKDAKELRRLGIKVQRLREVLRSETHEMAEALGDVDPPFSEQEKLYFRLLDKMTEILDKYDDLELIETLSGRFAIKRSSEMIAALRTGSIEAYERVPTVYLTWS
jgi:hypothetical protein